MRARHHPSCGRPLVGSLCLFVTVSGFALFGPPVAVAAAPPVSARPASRPAHPPPAKLGSGPQRVTFTTDDSVPVELVATYSPPVTDTRNRRAPMVILLHAEGEDRMSFDPLVPVLHKAGLAVLALDLRGHGQSVEPALLKLKQRADQRDPKLFREMVRDVEAAYRWLAHRPEADPARFALVGAGVGGSIALEYAVRDKSVDGVVMLTPKLNDLGLDPLASARKYTERKLLLLATSGDRAGAEAIGPLVPNSVVKIMTPRSSDGSAEPEPLQGTRMFGKVVGVEAATTEFILQAAGPASTAPVIASLKGRTFYEQSSRQADSLNADNVRYFNSAAEAQARGYRPPKQRSK